MKLGKAAGGVIAVIGVVVVGGSLAVGSQAIRGALPRTAAEISTPSPMDETPTPLETPAESPSPIPDSPSPMPSANSSAPASPAVRHSPPPPAAASPSAAPVIYCGEVYQSKPVPVNLTYTTPLYATCENALNHVASIGSVGPNCCAVIGYIHTSQGNVYRLAEGWIMPAGRV